MYSAEATATATLVSSPARLLGIYVRAAGTAGSLVLKDGGAAGTTLVTIDTPAAISGIYIPFAAGEAIVFETDIHATLTTADAVTIFYK